MKKFLYITFIICTMFILSTIDVKAYSSADYQYRSLCGNYELSAFKSNGSIEVVSCHNTFEEAKQAMIKNGADDLGIMTYVNGVVKILDANVALLDFSVNPTTLTYFYRTSEMNTFRYTYMDTGSLYGGVDGAIIETVLNSKGIWTALVKIGNQTGWVPQEAYEVVPITWVKSTSSYTVTNDYIRHNYVAKIQEPYYGSAGSTIGPKPDMLKPGTYYSYDGHYFYTDIKTMIFDYRNNIHTNSVNKNEPYYNYYMYLSNHTRTTYSSLNIDEYIRNNLGISEDAYGNKSNNGSSRLYGKGQFFYYAQEKYGANALLALSLSRNETSNGRSNLAINKNNGFGLNAVDSNPSEAANWYATFPSSILGYASNYVTYGYAHPRDWRYFGPQFGDKGLGMNVNYASDTYWSEKMAANYYAFDKSKGLQDYNFYQLGVVTAPVNAMSDASNSSKFIYTYPEAEDALVIIGEKEGEMINGSRIWYKVVSDLNIDSAFNEITSGNYNWNSYVYVPSAYVKKINKGKNGYISPNEVTEYLDKNYEYDFYDSEKYLKPKVAITTKNSSYYYDSSLQSKTGSIVLKNKYVMVYATAYSEGKPISYLITSNYWHDQKHWVNADSIDFVTCAYGHVTLTVPGNQYTWVNSITEDTEATIIGGQFTNSYVPVLEERRVGNDLWYKVPVNLTGTSNEYGWTLAASPGITVTLYTYTVENTAPEIIAMDKTVAQGTKLDELKDVKATDKEDGDLTKSVIVESSNVNIDVVGTYQITYKVTDSKNKSTTKTINVTVTENKKPEIVANDLTIALGTEFNSKDYATATDPEDGKITNIEVIKDDVDTSILGEYHVIYKVTDSFGNSVTKEIKVTVIEKKLIEKDGEFYLNKLSWNKTSKKYTISGYIIILNTNNNDKNAEYNLVLKEKSTSTEYSLKIPSWTNDVPYDIGIDNGFDYNGSWFKGEIDLSTIPAGDYDLYMQATKNEFHAEQLVTNLFNKPIDRRAEDQENGYNFKVQLSLKTKKIELNIRKDSLITTKTANTFRNMINNYDDIKFVDNKLQLVGTSYNYDGTYSKESDITRKLIIEDTKTYKQYTYDLGSTKIGSYEVISTDGKSKDYAWYNKKIDISNLPKGTYSLIVYTKTIDSEDYGEISDIFGSINKAEATISGKKYRVVLNKNRLNRIELVVE